MIILLFLSQLLIMDVMVFIVTYHTTETCSSDPEGSREIVDLESIEFAATLSVVRTTIKLATSLSSWGQSERAFL